MARKKRISAAVTDAATPPQSSTLETAAIEPEVPAPAGTSEVTDAQRSVERPAWIDGPPAQSAGVDRPDADHAEPPKHWGDPYKSIFNCREMGFELGEHRRFKQRVFKFSLKPTDEVLAQLKENGFTYRAGEKAWTIPASPATRKLTDELARQWAGPNYVQSVER